MAVDEKACIKWALGWAGDAKKCPECPIDYRVTCDENHSRGKPRDSSPRNFRRSAKVQKWVCVAEVLKKSRPDPPPSRLSDRVKPHELRPPTPTKLAHG